MLMPGLVPPKTNGWTSGRAVLDCAWATVPSVTQIVSP
jgi:hypothetical protein